MADNSQGNETMLINVEDQEIEVNVLGIVSIVVFYLVVLLIGLWAGWRQKKEQNQVDQETVMLAGRNIGVFVGVLTMGGE